MAYNDHLLPALAAKEPAAVDWMARAARLTLESGGEIDLMQAARLAPTLPKRREALRDRNLYDAALLLPLSRGRPSARRLLDELERFTAEYWPSWSKLHAPPTSATRIDAVLWYALTAAAAPESRQGLNKILRSFEATHLR